MRKFFRGTAFKLSLLIITALLVGTLAAAGLHGRTTPANAVVNTILSPLQRLSAQAAQGLSFFSLSFRSSAHLTRELEELQQENANLRDQLVDYEQAKKKNEMYQEFYGLKEEHTDYSFAEAAIIGRDSADAYGDFTLNKGSRHGISVGDAVVFGKSLVGVIVQTAPFEAKVRTLLNPAFNVGVYELSSNETGYISTDAALSAEGLCRMPELNAGTAIAPGGVICTSGITGNYPRDLHIGTVKQLLDDPVNISSYALIQPSAPFADLKDVFVITSFEGKANGSGERGVTP